MKSYILTLALTLLTLPAFADYSCDIVTTDETAISFMLRNNIPLVQDSAPHQMKINFDEDSTFLIVGEKLGTFTRGGDWIYEKTHIVTMEVQVIQDGVWRVLLSEQLSNKKRIPFHELNEEPAVFANLKEKLLRKTRRSLERYNCN